jgi:hypothetical protein
MYRIVTIIEAESASKALVAMNSKCPSSIGDASFIGDVPADRLPSLLVRNVLRLIKPVSDKFSL